MSKGGRLEAQMTVPVGGWAVSATNAAGGPTVVTVPAGSYYGSDLLTTFAAQLNASRPPGWTVTASLGEGGTGLVTINCSSTPWSITWTSTDLRNALGFTGNIVAVSSSQVGTSSLDGVWIPDCPMARRDTQYGNDIVSDRRDSISPDGSVFTLVGNTHLRHPPITWSHVSRARAQLPDRNSWYQWVVRTQLAASVSYFAPGSQFNLYIDADANTLSNLSPLKAPGLVDTKGMEPSVAGWDGRWRITTPDLILV